MSSIELGAVAAGLLLAGVVKGVTGIGYSTCALPLLAAAVGLKPAMAIAIVPAIVSNAAVIAGSDSLAATARRFWRFYGAIVPGIAIGAYALLHVDGRVAAQVLGWITIAYVALSVARPGLTLSPPAERALGIPAGLLNGILAGSTGSQILPLMPYMMALRLPPGEQVQAVNLAVTLASLVLATVLFHAGIMTRELALVSVVGALPAALGVLAGNRLRTGLSPSLFRALTLGVLAIVGATMARPRSATYAAAATRCEAPQDDGLCAAPLTREGGSRMK